MPYPPQESLPVVVVVVVVVVVNVTKYESRK
jgi:hypothetical protein